MTNMAMRKALYKESKNYNQQEISDILKTGMKRGQIEVIRSKWFFEK